MSRTDRWSALYGLLTLILLLFVLGGVRQVLWVRSAQARPQVPLSGESGQDSPALSSDPSISTEGPRKGDWFPLQACPHSNTDLAIVARPALLFVDGREVRFMCPNCRASSMEHLPALLANIDADIAELQRDDYPTSLCLVTGKPLASTPEGQPVEVVVFNRYFRVLDAEAGERLKAQPEKYIALLNELVMAREKPAYPFKTCLVSGEPLVGADIVEVVFNGHLVRLKGPESLKMFELNPQRHAQALREGRARAKADASTDAR